MSKTQSRQTKSRKKRPLRLSEFKEHKLSANQLPSQPQTRKHSAIKRIRTHSDVHPDVQESRPDLTQLLPVHIASDKQRLYSELIELKRSNQQLIRQNRKYKTRMRFDATQKSRLAAQICDHEKYHPTGGLSKLSSNLMKMLKIELQNSKDKNERLQRQIAELKKSKNITKLKQLQTQNAVYQRQLKMYAQERREFIEVVEQANNLKHQVAALKDKLIKRDQQIGAIKQQLSNRKRYAQSLKKERQPKIQHAGMNGSGLSFYQKQPKPHPQSPKQITDPTIESSRIPQQYKVIIQQQKQQISQLKALVDKKPIFPMESVRRIGQFLRFKLRAHHIPIIQCKDYLTPKHMLDKNEQISRLAIMNILSIEPFDIVCLTERLLFCDYLFQTSQQTVTADKLFQRFSQAIGHYQLDRIQDQDRLYVQICKLVSIQADKLNQALLTRCNGEGSISKQELLNVLQIFRFNTQQQLFVLTQLSIDSLNLDRISYYPLFDIFNQRPFPTSINPVQQLSEQYQGSNSNTNKRMAAHNQVISIEQDISKSPAAARSLRL